MKRTSVWLVSAATAAGIALAGPIGLSAAAGTGAHSTKITPPASIAKAGKMVFCSDVSYPPEEFFKGTTIAGSDIDIGGDIAHRMGVKAEFVNTGFDGIIAALNSNHCDAVISGMNDTPKRRTQVNFVDYISVPQSLMVQTGNPAHISNLNSLAGKTVGVEVGTTNYDYLNAVNATFRKKGLHPMNIVVYQADSNGASALAGGKLDVYDTDTPVVEYYAVNHPSQFQVAGPKVNPIPVGIALRKNSGALQMDVQLAVKAMYKDGTMARILARWHISSVAMKM